MAAPNTLRKHGEKQVLRHFYFYCVEDAYFLHLVQMLGDEYVQYLMSYVLWLLNNKASTWWMSDIYSLDLTMNFGNKYGYNQVWNKEQQ